VNWRYSGFSSRCLPTTVTNLADSAHNSRMALSRPATFPVTALSVQFDPRLPDFRMVRKVVRNLQCGQRTTFTKNRPNCFFFPGTLDMSAPHRGQILRRMIRFSVLGGNAFGLPHHAQALPEQFAHGRSAASNLGPPRPRDLRP
jgi:hypothetical protein